MTDRQAMEPFETRFAGRVRTYTDVATERRIDALAISRTAMASERATGWSPRRLGAGLLRRRIAGDRLAVALMTVLLVGVASIAILGRSSDSGIGSQATPPIASTPSPATSAGGAIPDVLRHAWQRPLPTVPGQVLWPTAFLSLVSGQLEFGPEPGPGASRSAITAADTDIVAVTATVETIGCAIGDVGHYRWSLTGKDTVMTLTAIGPDACAAREEALAGDWVRSDLPPPVDPEATLPPGTYQTRSFDPFGDPATSGQLSYTVREAWKIKEDQPGIFLLHHLPDARQGQPSTDTFILLLARPRMAADFQEGATCGAAGDAPGVGGGLDDLVAAITARPGVVSTTPAAVTIAGYEGKMLDLELATSWTGGCITPDGPVVGMTLLHQPGLETGPGVGLEPGRPVRLILLDLTGGRTLAVTIFEIDPSQRSLFQAHAAEVMPIIERFEFHPPTP
jgi:hypothetical protein